MNEIYFVLIIAAIYGAPHAPKAYGLSATVLLVFVAMYLKVMQ